MSTNQELKPGVIIFIPQHGFGTILKISSTTAEVQFYRPSKPSTVQIGNLSIVSSDIIDSIVDGSFTQDFSSTMLARGLTYANQDRVLAYGYDKNRKSLSASVMGSGRKFYDVEIQAASKGRRIFSTNCSCPVGSYCKHCAATLYTFAPIFKELDRIATDYSCLPPDKAINNLIIHSMASRSIDLAMLKAAIEGLRDEKNLKDFFTRLTIHVDDRYKNGIVRDLVYHCMADPGVFRIAINIKNAIASNTMRTMIQNASSAIPRTCAFYQSVGAPEDYRLMRVKYFLQGDYDHCIDACLNSIRNGLPRLNDSFYDNWIEPIEFIPKGYIAKDTTQNNIIDFLFSNLGRSNAHFFERFADDEHLRILYNSPKYTGPLSDDYILRQSPKDIFSILENRAVPNAVLHHIIDNVNNYADVDYKKTAKILEQGYYNVYSWKDKERIVKAATHLPDSDYFIAFLDTNPVNYHRHYDKTISCNLKRDKKIDAEKLFKYFTPDYEIISQAESKEYALYYILRSPANNIVMKAQMLDDEHINTRICDFADPYVGGLLKCTAEAVQKTSSLEIEEKIRVLQEAYEERQRQIKYKLLRDSAASLAQKQKAMLLGQKEQFSLQVLIEEGDDRNYILRLQFIQPKKYGVPYLYQFFDRFEKAEIESYGKNITLAHILSNFDKCSQDVISQLLNVYEYASYPSKKTMELPHRLCSSIVKAMVGREIEIDGEKYYLSEESKELQISIDKDMKICLHTLDGRPAPWKQLFMGDDILALDSDNGKAFFVDTDKENLELYRFASNFKDIDLSPVVDVMQEQVMPYFNKEIKLDESVKDAFPRSNLVIESYFDFDDKVLKHKEKLLLDGKEIQPGKLKKTEDILSYNHYHDIIETMGLVDGETAEGDHILNFLRMDFTDLKNYAQVFLSDAILNKRLSAFTKKTVQVQSEGNVMQAFMQPSEYTEEELEKIYNALRKKKKYTILSGNRIVALDNEDADEFIKVVDDLKLNPKKLYEQKQLSLAQSLRTLAHQSSCNIDSYLQQMIEEIQNFKEHKMEMPKLEATLRPYQEEGIKWLHVLSKYNIGGILADDMGLGKTLQIIALLASDKTKKPSLIVCPKSLIFNWKSEFEKFYPEMKVYEVYGNAAKRQEVLSSIKKNERSVYITAYDSLRGDMELYEKLSFNYIIADEAQAFKNTDTLKSQNVKKIKAIHRFALTGTPIENSITDLWSIFDFIIPGYFPELVQFQKQYGNDKNAHERLAKQIGPFLLRRTKELVLNDLPDKYERVITAEMTKEQRKLYDAYVHEARTRLEEGSKAFDMLPFITRLRQICVDPDMFVENYKGGSGKIDVLKNLISEYLENNHRILIFSQFTKALARVESMLKDMEVPYYLLTGDTPADKRIEMANAFNGGNKINVFLISLKAGGTGLNLIGADTIIHLDPWWNVAAENQATDRAHRIGQTRNVEVIKLICENTIEQRVIELQNTKKDIIDKVISKDDSSVTTARLEDISFLLG